MATPTVRRDAAWFQTRQSISRELADALEARNGTLKAGGSLSVEHDVTVPQIISAAQGRTNYVLDVKTFSWSTAYFPMSLSKYNVHYHAQGRLINADTGAVVGSGTCKDLPDSIDIAPNYVQMMANDGAVLKQWLAVEAAACAATLKRDMLAL